MTADFEPAAHYDRVTDAWGLLLGHELHYGVFNQGVEPLAEATRALTQRMVDGLRAEPGQRVLDVGCGTGAPACDLAESLGVEVLGITTSEVGVEAARARAQQRGVADRVRMVVATSIMKWPGLAWTGSGQPRLKFPLP